MLVALYFFVVAHFWKPSIFEVRDRVRIRVGIRVRIRARIRGDEFPQDS